MDPLNSNTKIPPAGIVLATFVSMLVSCGTSHQIRQAKTTLPASEDSLVTDRGGNSYRVKIMADKISWMTANLALNVPGSYCYESREEHCKQYGRLYTWESANEGCALLGGGWRLPTGEEWNQLALAYGGIGGDGKVNRKEAFQLLLSTGTSGFNAVLGGGRDGDGRYARIDAHGFYWTATQTDSTTAWFYNFAKGSQALYQQEQGEKYRAFSVRCVKGGK